VESTGRNKHKEAEKKQPWPAIEYRVAHIRYAAHTHKDRSTTSKKTDLLLVREVKGEKNTYYDSGSTISLMKLKYL